MESSNVGDRTQWHEIYAHPFLKNVIAGVASVSAFAFGVVTFGTDDPTPFIILAFSHA
jgi:hypothetical protein